MKIIKRKGSEVLIQDKQGRYWVTRRKKRRHDGRRQKGRECRVIYIPLYQIANPLFYN
jgi:hypothetical protein